MGFFRQLAKDYQVTESKCSPCTRGPGNSANSALQISFGLYVVSEIADRQRRTSTTCYFSLFIECN